MLLKSVDIQIFKIDEETFEPIGAINKFTSLIWPNKFNGYETFELHTPINEENKTLLKKGNFIWCGGDNAAVIEIIESKLNDEGEKVLIAKGRTLEVILTKRIIWGMYNCVNKYSSTAMYEIVSSQCINVDNLRKLPFLECAEDEQLGRLMSFQKTGGEVYDAIQNIATESDLGFSILFRPKEKKLIFKVIEGVDRTIMSASENGSEFVIFSTDLEDILSSTYYTNDQNLKTLAYVAGEGEGIDRKYIISGNNASSGFNRSELYVDARDLSSTIKNDDETETQLTDDDYNDLLNDRGKEKLAECFVTESFEAKMRVVGNIQYVYGVDYFLGDKVIIQDTDLGVEVVAKITEVSENIDDEYELILTFGYSHPTLIQRIKQQIRS